MSSSNGKPETVAPAGKDEKKDEKKDDAKKKDPMSSASEVMSFVWGCNAGTRIIFGIGCLGALGNGCVYPVLAYLFSSSFSKISNAEDGLAQIREVAYTFMVVGAFALVMASLQTGCLEVVAYRASRSFRLQWFHALLRQDAAFFDVYDVSGMASTIGPNSRKFQRGVGRKFGEGIQFSTTFLGGIGFAFYSSWRVAFVVLAVLPLVAAAGYATVVLNQTKGSRAARAYASAGNVAYSTVSAIKTVLSLNAVPEMIRQYSEATLAAYSESIRILWKQGLANGSMLGTFILLYCVLTLYGTFLLYRDVEGTGCDPSNGVSGNETCENSGPEVFGAMLGVAFAAQGLSQVGNFIETFTASRTACYQAMLAINRKPGSLQKEIMEETEEEFEDGDVEEGTAPKVKAILPEYLIDSSSQEGLKPENTRGAISFKDVTFSYPTRPHTTVLSGFDLEIEAGKTVAIVGPSGGGKSTTVSLIERFYDPASGSIDLDGVDLKDINVTHLRSLIGYVGQEPTLFATTIAGNIRYGNPDASQEQIEAAARMANAHDFITSFPDSYETQVGDKGAQLSGGQKQRVAIARVLVANPRILLLDEATSALDSESEIVVQDALDNVLAEHKRTTVVIAHRLSTIRNADVIAVVSGGRVVEKGSHDELMAAETGHYRSLVEKQERRGSSMGPSRESSEADLTSLDDSNHSSAYDMSSSKVATGSTHFEFRDVDFAYPTRPSKLVLNGFNLTVRAGETIALVGPSGGGKSTTVSLIERFYDPTAGSVSFSKVDIKDLNVKWYRDQIGYVGQEPTLFNTSIAQNIAYGAPGASQQDIELAAQMANAHDFIMSFPEKYDTNVGERGTQLSGGQKQRVAIARALVKKPQILLLDEATSALDTESESIVQEALDRLMGSKEHTTIVIAHRLSTIRDVDRIVYIADGKVKESGSHDELMAKSKGLYKRLVDSQRRGSTINASLLKKLGAKQAVTDEEEEEAEEIDFEAEIEKKEKEAFSLARARKMAAPDASYMFIGSVGSIMAGGVFPCWGILFAETINLLFRRVYNCETDEDAEVLGFDTCEEYNDFVADDMRETSFQLSGYWVIVAVGCVVGNVLLFWGFGMASERLNKRVRDSTFASLVRQEVAFFDKRSVGSITTQLEDDAARIHTFSGEPIRSFLVATSSVVTGVIISFIFMWPFALLSLATIPCMGFATEVEMRNMLGEDEGANSQDELNSPGGIVVETLINIRTVAALTLEKTRFHDYVSALKHENPRYVYNGFKTGFTSGLSMFIQQWVNALQLWWGGWLLFNYASSYTFDDFLISMFALLFSLFGLGAAFQGVSDRKETEKSAGRVFYLLDRKSEIDPLSDEGKKLSVNESESLWA